MHTKTDATTAAYLQNGLFAMHYASGLERLMPVLAAAFEREGSVAKSMAVPMVVVVPFVFSPLMLSPFMTAAPREHPQTAVCDRCAPGRCTLRLDSRSGEKRYTANARSQMYVQSRLQRGLRQIDGNEVYWDDRDLTKRDLIVGIGVANLGPTQAVREYEACGAIVYERVASSLYSGRC